MRTKVVSAICFGLLPTACASGQDSATQQVAPSALIVMPGATDVKRTSENDGVVAYVLATSYPANDVIGEISKRLMESGWTPLQRDFLNPELPLSFSTGWRSYEDGTAGGRHVFEWMGQWQDRTGRIVWYVLNYDANVAATAITASGPLHVRATLLSPEAVEGAKRSNRRGRAADGPASESLVRPTVWLAADIP
jgi:hypothetical protein